MRLVMISSISCISALILLREASGDKNFRYMEHRGGPGGRGVVPGVLSCAKRLLLVGGTSSAPLATWCHCGSRMAAVSAAGAVAVSWEAADAEEFPIHGEFGRGK